MPIVKGQGKWVKLAKPVPTYDKTKTEWTFDLVLDPAAKKHLAGLGVAKQIKTNKEGEDVIKFSRKTTKVDGEPSKPIEVVDREGKPWDGRLIGNGSTLNVMFFVNDNGNGPRASLFKVQVWDLVEYEGKGDSEEFPIDSSGAESWD